jgi:hypothetical protein
MFSPFKPKNIPFLVIRGEERNDMGKKKKSITFGPKHGAAEKMSSSLPQDHLVASTFFLASFR